MTAFPPSPNELDAIVHHACDLRATSSIRPIGSFRLLGDLQACGYEQGNALHFCGAKQRDTMPSLGTPITVSMLVGNVIISLKSSLLASFFPPDSETLLPPLIRVRWPQQRIEIHPRNAIRVATPDMPPLAATFRHAEQSCAVKLISLTETGMGIALPHRLYLDRESSVEIHTTLPNGTALSSMCRVRHVEWLEEDPCPTRLGLALGTLTDEAQEALRSFIQARRTDRCDALRSKW